MPTPFLLILFPLPALAADPVSQNAGFWLLLALALLQGLLIALLQKSRVRYKRARNELKQTKATLESRVEERTESLRHTNNQLTDAIARHEITEELLRETQDYLHSIINSMPSVLIGVSRKGHITLWNAAAERLVGVSSRAALGSNIQDLFPDLPISLSTVEAAIDQQLPQTLENIQQGQGSQARYTDVTVYPLVAVDMGGAVIRLDDVTLRVRVENMMIQNEKMLSLGELAAGLAHEINNPLAVILNNVQNIGRRTDPDNLANQQVAESLALDLNKAAAYWDAREIPKLLQHLREAGERSARIVSNMLEFSRNQHRDHQPTNMVKLLENSLDLAIHSMRIDTGTEVEIPQVKRHFSANLPLLHCSAIEIQQVILNLLRNAFQAFRQQDYGAPLNPTISIHAFTEHDWFNIVIEDNGPGMAETVRRHIFEPFYTTKDVGEGTGLGLSVSYFIITEHHAGTISVESEPGQGTRFTIRLPLSA